MWGGRTLALLAGAALLVGCASSTTHPVPGGTSFQDDEVRFVAPTGWDVQPSRAESFGSGGAIRLYLANQLLREDCPAGDPTTVCESVLGDGLRPGGVLVVWLSASCVAKACDLPTAPLIAVGNRQGVRLPLTDGCEGTGFTERSGYYVTVTPQRVDALLVCARDPSDATRSAFLGFLDAIHWRIP